MVASTVNSGSRWDATTFLIPDPDETSDTSLWIEDGERIECRLNVAVRFDLRLRAVPAVAFAA